METSPQSRVVFGLLGAGGISRSQHLPNLQRIPHIHLKTVCDLNGKLAKEARHLYGIPEVTTSHEDMLGDPEIEAVLIATRAESHVPLAIAALEAGKHVYVEKPLGETEDECRRVVAAQKRSGKKLAVAFNRRMAPAYQLATQIINSHGGAKNLHYRISDAYYLWGRESGLPPGMRIVHEVCHIFDFFRFLTGSEVATVHCISSRHDDDSIQLQFVNGCVASIMSTGSATYDMPKEQLEAIVDIGAVTVVDFVELKTFGLDDVQPVYRFAGHAHPERDQVHRQLFEMQGEQGMLSLRKIFYDTWRRVQKGHGSDEARVYLEKHAPMINYMMNKGWTEAVSHFAHCLLTGSPCQLATVEDGLQAARICQAALLSRKTKKVVSLEHQINGHSLLSEQLSGVEG